MGGQWIQISNHAKCLACKLGMVLDTCTVYVYGNRSSKARIGSKNKVAGAATHLGFDSVVLRKESQSSSPTLL